MKGRETHIVQVTATSYSRDGVIGGGERIAVYIDHALRSVSEKGGIPVTTTLLSLDGREARGSQKDRHQAVVGRAWEAASLDASDLISRLEHADVVYVHQCLTQVGLFVAAHARLLGKRVYGMDAGAGEAPILNTNPYVMRVYDAVHSLSHFGVSAFGNSDVPVHVIAGPVDTELHRPAPDLGTRRDPKLVLCVGRVLPHKGQDRIIRALPMGMSLLIVGQLYDQAYAEYLRNMIGEKDISFADNLEDEQVQGLLHRAGTFVHASTHTDYVGRFIQKPELLGLAPLEALASGLPTLVSDAASLPELSRLTGCRVFHNDGELSSMLLGVLNGGAPNFDSHAMHADVDRHFGMDTVGKRLLEMMGVN